MAFNATCPTCAARLRVEERLIGQMRKCPKCGEGFQIQKQPEASEADVPVFGEEAAKDESQEPPLKSVPSFASQFAVVVRQKRTLTVAASLALFAFVGSFILWRPSSKERLDPTKEKAFDESPEGKTLARKKKLLDQISSLLDEQRGFYEMSGDASSRGSLGAANKYLQQGLDTGRRIQYLNEELDRIRALEIGQKARD